MKTRFFKGMDERDVEVAKEHFHKAVGFRKDLKRLINEDIEALHASMRDEDSFTNPNWPYMQADRVAQTKALKKVLSLLD